MSQSKSQSSVNFIQPISMYNRKDLSKMSKDELINMLMGEQTASANKAGPVKTDCERQSGRTSLQA